MIEIICMGTLILFKFYAWHVYNYTPLPFFERTLLNLHIVKTKEQAAKFMIGVVILAVIFTGFIIYFSSHSSSKIPPNLLKDGVVNDTIPEPRI